MVGGLDGGKMAEVSGVAGVGKVSGRLRPEGEVEAAAAGSGAGTVED